MQEQSGFWLSPQQKFAWRIQEAIGRAARVVGLLSLEGKVEVTRLRSALIEVVSRHEALRTVFCRPAGMKMPLQMVLDAAEIEWERREFSGLGPGDQQREIELLFEREQSFEGNSESGPVLRVFFLQLGHERSVLLLSLSTLCADARSLQLLMNESAAIYRGSQHDLPEAFRYLQFAQWQSDLLESDEDDAKQGRDFWAKRITNSLSSPTLPSEKKSFDTQSHPQLIAVPVSKELAAPLLNYSDPRSALFAAWQSLLYRLSGQNAFTTGLFAENREYEELQNAVGCFGRTLPLAVRIESTFTFADVLRRTEDAIRDAIAVQEYFVPEAIGFDGELISFAYDDLSAEEDAAGIHFTLERVQVVSERFKLRLNVVRRGSEMMLEFHYDAARFERSAIERIAGYYIHLLTAALANPATPVSRLPLLAEAERKQLLVEWNQTTVAYPADKCLHQLFEQQAARVSDRMAVRCGEQALTYRELNERANQLAHYLRKQGVGPDSRVGLCLDRSVAMLVAVLGILKAGGAYVPLNADNPPARLKQQLEGARALITEAKLAQQMPEFSGITVVLDRDEKVWANEPKSNPAANTTPDNLVYVIFTSGSTGVPKGVAVRHRNLVNYADFITKKLTLEQHPEGLQFATVSTLGADLGNTCIYPALISGGSLHIFTHEVATDPQQFASYTAKYPMDVLKIVPSHLQALLQSSSDEAAKILPRRYLITGGEALTPKLLEKIASLNPTCEILNHYGPTETTVGSLTLELKRYEWKNAGLATIPIGRPIQNTQTYILDPNLDPVPVGVAGELYIAGAGVTAGYLGQPEKTAERFVKNPFSDGANATMYRTGDLARYGADGNIEFLGRDDDQVKIRGFRIELGEIESVLAQHPAVKQAVVLARATDSNNNNEDKRLLAYVVLHREAASSANNHGAVTSESLRQHLQQHLPDYMVPQAVMLLAKLPLNANGKLDRQALPEPEQAASQKTFIAPRTGTEQTIAEVWAEVLRRDKDKISANDNFFDLGGHSLLATQVVSRLRRALNIELPLRTLFECPTVAALARQSEALSTTAQPEIPHLVRVPRDKPLPLSFAQQRLWVLDRIEPNNPLYNIPRAIRLKGNLNTNALMAALNEIVRRHESQRTTFSTGPDSQPVQVISESLDLRVEINDLSNLPAPERESRAQDTAAKEARTPFDLCKGPLLRATILRLGISEHVLLLTMHHIVSDAWSSGIFFRELGELYTAFLEGKPSPLAELTIQYADYAAWQRNFLQGKVLENQLSYWREHLRGVPPLLTLPSNRSRPEVRKFHGAYEPIPLAKDITEEIKRYSVQQGVTPFMTMLAAFNALLSRYSGEQHIVLGTDIANRTTAETERLIGFFINLLPLHTDLSGDPTFHELVLRVREVALGAYAHQDIPFDKLVEDLQPERSLSHNPIVQALFVMQNIPAQRLELPGLAQTNFPASITRSKFDVAVFIRENKDGMFQDWLYSTELFELGTILQMASNFENLLRNAISHPELRLSSLEIYGAEEKKRMENQKSERKQTQRKKLMSAAPKSVSLASSEREQP